MRTFLFPFLFVVILGCRASQPPPTGDLAIWRSNSASLKQRVEAASRLVPHGTKQVVAEEVLGQPGRRERFYGPVIYGPGYEGPTNVTYSDTWHDVYDFKNGDYVRVVFDIEASRNTWEDRPLLTVSGGNTNRDRLLVFPSNTR